MWLILLLGLIIREGCIEGSSRRIMDLFIYVMFKFFVIVNSFIFSL